MGLHIGLNRRFYKGVTFSNREAFCSVWNPCYLSSIDIYIFATKCRSIRKWSNRFLHMFGSSTDNGINDNAHVQLCISYLYLHYKSRRCLVDLRRTASSNRSTNEQTKPHAQLCISYTFSLQVSALPCASSSDY